MSRINDDKSVVQNGRKNALKDVDANKRDQIPSKLLDKLEELEVGRKVDELWNLGNTDRAEWLQRQEEYLADWDEHVVSTSEGAFTGASTLHLPIPLIVCKTVHARFLQAILGIDPYFTVKSRTAALTDRAPAIQELMSYTLKDWVNYYTGIDEALDAWLWDWVTTGCGLMKARWDTQYERFVDVVTEIKQDFEYQVDPETGQEVRVPKMVQEEVEKAVTKLKFAGPVFEHRHVEDVLFIGGKGDPQRADSVIECYYLTASELWTLADQKIFDADVVEEAIDSGPDRIDGEPHTQIKQQRAANAGKATHDTEADLDRYKVYEAYMRMDVDGSGINTDVVVWVHARSKNILRATYLHRINKSGERPYFKIDFHKRAGQDYGTGLIEMLHPLSVEMDALHNLRIDFGLISTMPFGFYRPTSSLEPETLQLEPGALIPVDNPQTDVFFPNLGNRTAFGFQEEAAVYTLIERLTGINDLSLGVLSGAQGATRTATGARALLGESNANLDVFLRRMQRGWKQALKYLMHMLQQRLPDGFSFRVQGEDGSDYWREVAKRSDIAGDFDFEISPNTANSNVSIQQEMATTIFQSVQNPLLIQMGVVGPGNIYEAFKDYLKALGIKNCSKYVSKPQGYELILTPQEEVDRILRGFDVQVVPQMDHQGYLEYFQQIYDDDQLLAQFSEEQAKILKIQAMKHEKMIEALEAAAAQAANQAAARQNAQTSAIQAPPGQNPLAGAMGSVGTQNQQ